MLTLYSVVKGFEGKMALMQRNAVQSWRAVVPDAQLLWFGDDEPGAAEEAERFGVELLPMTRTEAGAPLVRDVIERAHEAARHKLRCLVNADILLEPSFAPAVRLVAGQLAAFLLVMRRYNVQVDGALDFTADWHAQVVALPNKAYTLSGIDVFCYRGDWLAGMPAFGMGRTCWDNWIVAHARRSKVPIVDATQYTRAYHQEHQKRKPPDEVRRNRQMLKAEFSRTPGLNTATHRISPTGRLKEMRK